VRILLIADSHLGLDFPLRPRVQRRRRGPDFFANFALALKPAFEGDVDFVVHGGDLLFRSKVPDQIIEKAMAPFVELAKYGVPIYIVPSNHERSRIPLRLWSSHPNLHIFDRPRTFCFTKGDSRVALSGFPFQRRIREVFPGVLEKSGYQEVVADARLLCMHQTVEGAQVGPSDFTFRYGKDILQGSQIPEGFAAVLAGHIHRGQILTHSLDQRPFAAPVIYPGSIERTSFAERYEEKGYAIVNIDLKLPLSGVGVQVKFHPLPTRPMFMVDIEADGHTVDAIRAKIQECLQALDPESIVRIRLSGDMKHEYLELLSAPSLRSLAPVRMNVSTSYRNFGLEQS
jgi:DNA repair exonuclease SbcCD nuclease subunit